MNKPIIILLLLTCCFLSCKQNTTSTKINPKGEPQPFGVNLAGAEFGESNMPGVYDVHYTYPTIEELDYFKSKGLTLIRLPFKWERVQPELCGELNTEAMAQLKRVVEAAAEREMSIIPDLHNYARRYHHGEKMIIGVKDVRIEHLADFWKRFALEMKPYDNIYGHGLMNEPYDLPSSSLWFNMAQACINAIREVEFQKAIIVGGEDWSSAERWKSRSDTLKHLSDPVNNLIFEAHVYFDEDASGSYKRSYDEEKCTPQKGVERVQPFVSWLKENGLQGFIGEYGVPQDDPRWLETMDQFLAYLKKEGVNATYWAAGPWWGKYKLSLEPKQGEDKPQMKVVEKYIYTDVRG